MTGQKIEVALNVLGQAGARLDDHIGPRQRMSDVIDNALLTAEYLGRPAVATAVTAYLAAVDDRSVALRQHLSAMASALAQSAVGYADTDDQIRSGLGVHTADDHLSDDHPLRRPA